MIMLTKVWYVGKCGYVDKSVVMLESAVILKCWGDVEDLVYRGASTEYEYLIIGFVNFCQNKMEVIEITLDKSEFMFNFN